MHDEQSPPEEKTTVEPASSADTSESSDVFTLIEDVERHLSRIRTAQSRQAEEFADLATRMKEVEDAEETLSSRSHEVDDARVKLEEDRVAIEQSRTETEELRVLVDQMSVECNEARNTIDGDREQIEEHRTSIQQREKSLTEGRTEFEQHRQEFESQQAEFLKNSQQAEEELKNIQADREELAAFKVQAETSIAKHIQDVNNLGAEVEHTQSAIAELEKAKSHLITRAEGAETERDESVARCSALTTECENARNQLRKAGERLGELAHVVSEQVPQLEEGAAAMATVHEQARAISELQARIFCRSWLGYIHHLKSCKA
jgi:epidermal growth factor receptor substrate 15